MRIAVVGDVHLCWDDADVELLDAAGYDLALFVGDLAGYGAEGAVIVARSIAKLRTPALVLPGNHDAATVPQFAAEVFRAPDVLRDALSLGMSRRVDALACALSPAKLCGYDLHAFERAGVTVLSARPHTIGGERLAFRRYLAERFGVRTLADSAARLCELFDRVPAEQHIIVLAHCGPTGLGGRRSDIYGSDFRPEEGDWGDPDLARALVHARSTHKTVAAVVAGHMHHRLRGGGERTWYLERDGVHHINAARVPRMRRSTGERHHVRLTIEGKSVRVETQWLAPSCNRARGG
jgi:uncharacterized protein (TIGR04168 family)